MMTTDSTNSTKLACAERELKMRMEAIAADYRWLVSKEGLI